MNLLSMTTIALLLICILGQTFAEQPFLSNVLLIYTGGTIGMCPNVREVYAPEKGYLTKLFRDTPALNDMPYVEKAYANSHIKPYSLPLIKGNRRVIYWMEEYEPLLDSSEMGFADWIRIANDIQKHYDQYDGFVILHGTDTMAYTASALSFMLENLGKPVVLTGSQEQHYIFKMMSISLAGEMNVVESNVLKRSLSSINSFAGKAEKIFPMTSGEIRDILINALISNAAFKNDMNGLEKLNLSGAKLYVKDYHMRSALHVAAAAGSVESVKYLLKHGANVHIRDDNNENPLISAVKSQQMEIIKMIKAAGGQLHIDREKLGIELCTAALMDNLEAIKCWHAAGAGSNDFDLSAPDHHKRTALHVAASQANYPICEFLITNGADVKAKNQYGETALEEAQKQLKGQHPLKGELQKVIQLLLHSDGGGKHQKAKTG